MSHVDHALAGDLRHFSLQSRKGFGISLLALACVFGAAIGELWILAKLKS